jgi:hypothetical protein
MSTNWIYRAHLFIRVGQAAEANQLAVEVGPGGESERETFSSVGLSALGIGTPTDLGCSTLMTQAMADAVEAAAQSSTLGSLRFYILDSSTELLIATNSPSAADEIGAAWNWQRSASDMGLSLITTESDDL